MRILLQSIYPYIFLLLYFTIPFDNYVRALPNILLITLAIAFPFVVQKNDFKKLKKLPTLIFIGFVIFVLVQALALGRLRIDSPVLEKINLAIGLVVLYIPIQGFKKIKKAIIFSSVAAIVFSVTSIIVSVYKGADFQFMDSGNIIEAMLVDRLYLGLLCVFSIVASYSLLKKTYHPNNGYYVVAIILNVLFILLIVSRIAIIALIVLFILGFFYKRSKGTQLVFVVATLFLGLVLVFILNNDFRKKIFYTPTNTESKGLVANTLEMEPRTIIWNCALTVSEVNNELWKGLGFASTNEELINCYQDSIEDEEKRAWLVSKKYNTHNQFLDIRLATGIVGTLLFVGFILLVFLRNKREFFPTALLLTIVLFLLVENLFHRQIGAYYVGFVLILLLIKQDKPQNETIEAA
ncbi:O-antigen ligase family protein [Marinirhabdus gelatinilytica]|uniref:O-antigen ligase n=1 Tax=Marinirhabdus gelatinilytica TaxID=1703343 RepID=A0A370QJK9_9FLAO|nr:O-antigen ligase family protein [Marinirhabdus gelatinilytica]RDK88526.1 O-antigen ligase [Marinirhabdus gelatinilytica]